MRVCAAGVLEGDLVEAQAHLGVARLVQAVYVVEPLRRLGGHWRAGVQRLEEHDHLVRVPVRDVVGAKLALAAWRARGNGALPAVREIDRVARKRVVVRHLDRQRHALAVEPRVPVDGVEGSGDRRVVRIEGVQVRAPVVRGDRAPGELGKVRADVRLKDGEAADDALEVQQKVGALFVRDRRERIIGVLAVAVLGDQALEARHMRKALERVAQRLGADDVGKAAVRGAVIVRMHALKQEAL